MKKYLLVRLFVLGSSAFLLTSATSQYSLERVASNDSRSQSHRTYTAAGVDADKAALASLKAVNSKMFSHFTKNFLDASDIRISTVGTSTEISFKKDGAATKVMYNKKGRFDYSIKTYEVSKLADDVRDQVEAAYAGYRTFGVVSEIDVQGKHASLVMIENRKTWKRVRIMDGDIQTYEEYNKP